MENKLEGVMCYQGLAGDTPWRPHVGLDFTFRRAARDVFVQVLVRPQRLALKEQAREKTRKRKRTETTHGTASAPVTSPKKS